MFPFFAVPILYFPSPSILPVLSVESYSPLVFFSPARQVFFLNLVLKNKQNQKQLFQCTISMSSPWCQRADTVTRQALAMRPRYLISLHLSVPIWGILPCVYIARFLGELI